MTDKRETAHEILAQHVTNVSQVTATVIKRAVAEYEALAAQKGIDPTDEALQFRADVVQLLNDIDSAAMIFERTMHSIRSRIQATLRPSGITFVEQPEQEQPDQGSNGVT